MIFDFLKRQRPRRDLRDLPEAVPDISSTSPRERFLRLAQDLDPSSSVLEVGTRRTMEDVPTHSQHAFPNVARTNYIMVDVRPGIDVDIIADLHRLSDDWTGRFDALIAIAVFEHLERPWLAAKEVARVLAPGGFCYISTHQTFPLHGHPSDFFRFSREALTLLFEDAGLQVVDVAYEHRAKIIAPESVVPKFALDSWNAFWPSYLVVHLLAERSRT